VGMVCLGAIRHPVVVDFVIIVLDATRTPVCMPSAVNNADICA
jgi:hypothetical protein